MSLRAHMVLAAVVIVSSASPAVGDTVHLKDGIILKGEITEIDDGDLVIDTDSLDEVTVDMGDVAALETTRPVTVRDQDGEEYEGYAVLGEDGKLSITSAPPRGEEAPEEELPMPSPVFEDAVGPGVEQAAEKPGREPAAVAVIERKDLESMNPVEPYYRYEAALDVGINISSGNTDIQTFNLSGFLEPSFGKNTISLQGQLNRQTTGDVLGASNWRILAEYLREFRPRWYTVVLNSYENDDLQGLHLRITGGLGLAYKILDRDPTHLRVMAAPAYVSENFRGTDDDRQFPSLRWGLDFEQHVFSSDVNFFHNHVITIGGTDTAQFIALTATGLKFDLISDFYLNVEYQFDYNNRPAQDAKNVDQRFILSLGYEAKGDETDWWH